MKASTLSRLPAVFYKLGFYSALLAVLVLSLLPLEHPDVSPNDKVNHAIAYCVLTILGFLAHRRPKLLALLVFVFGVLIEFLQALTGYRFFSLPDMLANGVGVVIALGILAGQHYFFKSRKQELL